MESLYIKIANVLASMNAILDKVPLIQLRRNAIKIYSEKIDTPFEYVLAKGFVTGSIIMLLIMLYAMTSNLESLALVLMIGSSIPIGVYLQFQETKRILLKYEREVTITFSRLSSNCSMFLASGLSVRRAFELSAENLEESQIALQIEKAVSDLRMNANTSEVFAALNNRVRHPFVAEFTSILEQTEKYGVGSNADLDRLIKNSWQIRRDSASQAAKEMETKLVFPSMLIFFGVMIMIAVGMLMQLSM